jgi:predicted RNA-binding Zn-ribbon protein involved in translation (DUF1610 family)
MSRKRAALFAAFDSLAPLPCGCVVVLEGRGRYFECPWCAAVFLARELGEWWSGAAPDLIVLAMPALFRFGTTVIELTAAECEDCGELLVRECGERTRVKFHLPAPLPIERLWD